MPCIPIKNGIVCMAGAIYEYKGFLFEVHRYFGPMRMRKSDWGGSAYTGPKFWAAWEEFEKLPDEEKAKYEA